MPPHTVPVTLTFDLLTWKVVT